MAVAEEIYPIRTVVSMTGVNAVTLRAWERRYGLVRPRRSPSGHRLYSPGDVERLRRVVALTQQGVSIGKVADLLPDEEVEPGNAAEGGGMHESWAGYVDRMLEAIARFDEPALNAVYNETLGLYPVDVVSDRALMPVLQALGERWKKRPGGIAEEHFFTNYLRTKIGARLHHLSQTTTGPRLLAGCMPDERHDLGLLMFGHTATVHGYRVVMLGGGLPLSTLPPATRAAGVDALLLSMSVVPAPRVLAAELDTLVRGVSVPVLLGGRVSQRCRADIQAAGAHVLGASFAPALAQLDALLGYARHAPGRARE